MYKIKNYCFLFCLAFVAIASSCEQEGLNEEELLNLTTSTSLTISAVQQGSQRPIEGVAVSLLSGGNAFEAVTDQYGQAYFSDVSQGDVLIQMSKEGYFSVKEQREIQSSGRLAGDRVIFSLYAEEDAAIVRGQVKIQADLTNEVTEYAEAITLNLISNNSVVASGTTNELGQFEILVPTSESGRSFSLEVPELQRDQKIYVLVDSEPVLSTAVSTIFRPYMEAERLPNTSNIILEIEVPDFDEGWQAYVKSFEIGESITGVTLGDTGFGYINSTSIKVYVNGVETVTNIQLETENNFTDFCRFPEYYQIIRSSAKITDGGLGYPDYVPNLNASTKHPTGFKWNRCSNLDRSIRISSGEIIVLDLDYGTGTITGNIQ